MSYSVRKGVCYSFLGAAGDLVRGESSCHCFFFFLSAVNVRTISVVRKDTWQFSGISKNECRTNIFVHCVCVWLMSLLILASVKRLTTLQWNSTLSVLHLLWKCVCHVLCSSFDLKSELTAALWLCTRRLLDCDVFTGYGNFQHFKVTKEFIQRAHGLLNKICSVSLCNTNTVKLLIWRLKLMKMMLHSNSFPLVALV